MKKISILKLYKDNTIDISATSGLVQDHLDSLATINDDDIQKKLLKELIHKYVNLEKKVDSPRS